jgi:lysine-arginine-ornithine-binding protein
MKLTSLIAAAALTVAASGTAFAEEYKIGVDASFPPFSEVKGDGSVVGLEVDFINELCTRIDAECEIVPMQFDALISGLQARKIDMIIGSMSITGERAKVINFSDRYYNAPIQFVTRFDAPSDMAADAVIGVERGSISASYADNELKSATIKTYDAQLAAMKDLEVGRVDYVLGDLLTIYDWLEEGAKAQFILAGESISDPAFVGDGIGIGLRKSDDELLATVNAAIAGIADDGTFDEITSDYFPFSIR